MTSHRLVIFLLKRISVSSKSFIPSDPGTRKFKGEPGCRVYLIRHGEVANAHLICMNGHYDVALSEKGEEQMREVAEALSPLPLQAVYSSDLTRTLTGARLIAEKHNLDPIAFPEIRELSFGKWEGLSVKELTEKFPGEMEKRIKHTELFRADGGETFDELAARVVPRYNAIIEQHPNDVIAIMSHGGVNRTILSHLLGIPTAHLFRFAQEYAAINVIQYYTDQVVVELMNGSTREIATCLP
nr:histidine phosphatase family protein [Nitrospina gracilis]